MASRKKNDQDAWEEKITDALVARDEWADTFQVEKCISYFEGKSNPGVPDDEWLNVNKIFSHIQAQLPTLYAVDPYFYVKLRKSFTPNPESIAEMERKGEQRGSYLNHLKAELNGGQGLKPTARLAIRDAYFAFGVVSIRRTSDLEEHPQAGETIVDEDGEPILTEAGEEQVYPDSIPINERYEVTRLHWKDFVFDPDAGPLPESWNWVAARTQMTKQEMLDDPRYKNSIVANIAGKEKGKEGGASKLKEFFAGSNQTDDEDEVVDVWQIYDLKKREWLTVAMGAKQILVKPKPTPPGTDKHSFALLRFIPRDTGPYPIPPVYNAIDPQFELSNARSKMMVHRKRFNRKYVLVESKVEDPDTAMETLTLGDDGAVIRAMANGPVEVVSDAPLDQMGLIELRELDADITAAMGITGNARGIADSDSATEAGIMDARLGIREGDTASLVIDFVIDIAKKLDALVQVHIDGDEAVKILGSDGEEVWQEIKQSDYSEVEGEFEYQIDVGAMQPRLPDIERAQLTAFLSQVVIPFPAILTNRPLVKKFASLYHIEDEATINALIELGNKVVSGQLPGPGNQGGGPSDNPVAAILGAAGGAAGGNANGGGVNA